MHLDVEVRSHNACRASPRALARASASRLYRPKRTACSRLSADHGQSVIRHGGDAVVGLAGALT